MEPTVSPEKWSRLQKIAFRFWASYLFLYIIPFPFNQVLGGVCYRIGQYFNPIVCWAGRKLFRIAYDLTNGPNGSGDTSYDYAQLFVLFWLAIFACTLWSLLDRKRNDYNKLLYFLKVLVRVYLAYFLMSYGFSKLPYGQFLPPSVRRLSQSYGASSPMGLAWTFLGYSTAFGLFMGFFETIGGLLLVFRRTVLLGACIATTVTCNIVMINFCYDVPVKIFSTHLLLMSVFLIGTEGRRFINFFFLNRHVAAPSIRPAFKSKGWRITRILLKLAFVAMMIMLLYTKTKQSTYLARVFDSNFYATYTIDSFVQNHKALPPMVAYNNQWQTLEISMYKPYVTIVLLNGKKTYFNVERDPQHDSLRISLVRDSITNYNMAYHRVDSTLTIEGIYLKDTFFIKMHSPAEKKYLLTSRGFHWINEYPFNR
jgi:hypothetical protein